jgi:5-methylcytosine-specific restriction endonuclease McrA
MSIRREWRKKYYGKAWRAYRLALIEAHGTLCSVCRRRIERYLNLAHTSHDPRSSDVALMCPACHARHDKHQAYAVRRRNHATKYGQGWLWQELALAPFPAWLTRRARRDDGDEKQGGLF